MSIKNYKELLIPIAILLVPFFSLFWLPDTEILGHGLTYPWPGLSGISDIVGYHLSTWLFGPNMDFTSFLFYSYVAIASFIGGSSHTGQILFFYFGYVGCIGGMYFLAKTLGFRPIAALISGVLYLLSPAVISGIPVEIVNLRLLPYFISTPILLTVVIKLFRSAEYGKYLALLGIVSILLCSAGYGSLQYFVLQLILVAGFAVYYVVSNWTEKDKLQSFVNKAVCILIVIFISNYYWLSSFLFDLNAAFVARHEIGVDDASLLRTLSVKLIDSFRMLPYPNQANISPWIAYYYTPILSIVIFAFAGVGVFSLFTRETRSIALFPAIMLIVLLFLGKGVLNPFAGVGEVIFYSFPYVTRLFRNPNYFNNLTVLFLPLLTGLGLGEIVRMASAKSKKHLALATVCISCLIVIYSWQFVIGGPIKSQPATNNAQSVKVPQYFADLAYRLKREKLVYRNLEVPIFTSKSWFVAFDWGKTYFGIPPFNVWSDKFFVNPFIGGQAELVVDNAIHPEKDAMPYNVWLKVLKYFNVRHVVYYKDTAWKFLKRRDPSFSIGQRKVESFLASNPFARSTKSFGKIDLLSLDSKYFLPMFYTPKAIVWSNYPFQVMRHTSAEQSLQVRSVILSDSTKSTITERTDRLTVNTVDLPVLEFKKISEAKYRVRVHGAKHPFPMVFSNGFNKDWKVYLQRIPSSGVNSEKIIGYKILDGNEEDQAEIGEVNEFDRKGWISSLGDGKARITKHWKWEDGREKLDHEEKYKIGFISKNFQDTIQNDNLPSRHFYETWFKRPLMEETHLIANGYANSWIIDPKKLCESSPNTCIKNVSSSYDFELIVEYWPQRLLDIGLLISGAMLFACICYLLYYLGRKCLAKSVKKGRETYIQKI